MVTTPMASTTPTEYASDRMSNAADYAADKTAYRADNSAKYSSNRVTERSEGVPRDFHRMN
ncbi:hypothetical protein C8D77_107157 [Mesorhizobium loti]|uniref:Uncharacterized protein n=3 Tax=Phyllobacteriaceae TaxID=69277 RepID=A0A8E2W9R3_RHILI|nr:conserved hypothetical protein [Mesorhizobium opportunistum WSM2075]PWJ89513.1 hypothetical protein C8D77_107157 [Mesorhizobium loti]